MALVEESEIAFGKRLGAGTFGEVFAATWRGSRVAVKRLLVDGLDQQVLDDFKHEVDLLIGLRHPRIVLLMAATTPSRDRAPCIVLEFVEGGSLYQALHVGRRPVAEASIAVDIAEALSFLHSAKPPIIHRDLKSLNVLLDTDGRRAKLCDFGLAGVKTASASAAGSSPCGTWQYMAPEVMSSAPYSLSADIYGFGMLLFELANKEVPFGRMGIAQIVRVVSVDGQRPSLSPKVPTDWRDLIEQCWPQDPARRPTALEVLARAQKLQPLAPTAPSDQAAPSSTVLASTPSTPGVLPSVPPSSAPSSVLSSTPALLPSTPPPTIPPGAKQIILEPDCVVVGGEEFTFGPGAPPASIEELCRFLEAQQPFKSSKVVPFSAKGRRLGSLKDSASLVASVTLERPTPSPAPPAPAAESVKSLPAQPPPRPVDTTSSIIWVSSPQEFNRYAEQLQTLLAARRWAEALPILKGLCACPLIENSPQISQPLREWLQVCQAHLSAASSSVPLRSVDPPPVKDKPPAPDSPAPVPLAAGAAKPGAAQVGLLSLQPPSAGGQVVAKLWNVLVSDRFVILNNATSATFVCRVSASPSSQRLLSATGVAPASYQPNTLQEFILHPGAQKVKVSIGDTVKCYITVAHQLPDRRYSIAWESREVPDRTNVTFSDKHVQSSVRTVSPDAWELAGRYM